MKTVAQLGFIGLAATSVYLFVSVVQDGDARAACTPLCALAPQYAGRDRTVPDFELQDLSGRAVRMSSLRGKTVILNFWTKTCRPCLEEMPSLDELAVLLRSEGRDAVVLTISTDGSAADAKATLETVLGRPANFMTLVDPDAAVVSGKFGTRLYPETWLIDPRGTIRVRVDGARDWSNALVLNLLDTLDRRMGACPITFDRGKARNDPRGLCGAGE